MAGGHRGRSLSKVSWDNESRSPRRSGSLSKTFWKSLQVVLEVTLGGVLEVALEGVLQVVFKKTILELTLEVVLSVNNDDDMVKKEVILGVNIDDIMKRRGIQFTD